MSERSVQRASMNGTDLKMSRCRLMRRRAGSKITARPARLHSAIEAPAAGGVRFKSDFLSQAGRQIQ